MTETEQNPTPPFVQKDMQRAIPRRWLAALIITAVVLGLSVYPGKWLSMQPVFAQIFAPRGFWILISFLALLASVVVFGVRWHRDLPRRVSALFMAITLVATFAHVSVGWGGGLRVDPLHTVATPNKGYFGTDITVMSLNGYDNGARPVTIAKLANAVGADIVMLTETTEGTAKLVAQLMEEAGSPMQMFQSVPSTRRGSDKINQTVLLVSTSAPTRWMRRSPPRLRWGPLLLPRKAATPTSSTCPRWLRGTFTPRTCCTLAAGAMR